MDNENFKKLGDRDLYNLCQKYGSNARMWQRKFASLLPEVEKRELYRKYGFYSIYEFAAKLGGLTHKTVEEILRVYRRVESKPLLKKQVVKIGWGKVRAVTALINEVKEENLVEMTENLPKQALEETVRLIKKQKGDELTTPPGWGKKMASGSKSDFQKWQTMSFKVDSETEFRLRKYQQKLQKEKKEPVPFNIVLKKLLDEVEKGEGAARVTKREKQKIKKTKKLKIEAKTSKKDKPQMEKLKDSFAVTVSRYVNAQIRLEIDHIYHGKCAFRGCNKPHAILHHPDRFSLNPSHENIVPLCDQHHQIVHAGLVKNEHLAPEFWEMRETADKSDVKYRVDKKVVEHWKAGECVSKR